MRTLLRALGLASGLLAGFLATAGDIEEMRKRADGGDVAAQVSLGVTYSIGDGVAKDPAEAAKWYRKAADQRHAGAQFELGYMYANGAGVAKDQTEAVKWYRKAAEQGDAMAQFNLGLIYANGDGVAKDQSEAVKWYRLAADQGDARAQVNLGRMYDSGEGVAKDQTEAVKWYRKAAEQGDMGGQNNLAYMYDHGYGVAKDDAEAVKLYQKSAHQGGADAMTGLGCKYARGEGVPKDDVAAYKWWNLAAAAGNSDAAFNRRKLELRMTPSQIAEAQRLSREFKVRKETSSNEGLDGEDQQGGALSRAKTMGSGFLVTAEGYIVTSAHVIVEGGKVSVVTQAGTLPATVVRLDSSNDLAVLKVSGTFTALPVISSRTVRMGESVSTVGFPNPSLQGFSPKFSTGDISSLTGPQDDPRFFQISIPIQPGNSGGAMVDARGNVAGVIAAKLGVQAALATSGALPENVNYAVKSSFLMALLESLPSVNAKLAEPNAKARTQEEIARVLQAATVLVVVE